MENENVMNVHKKDECVICKKPIETSQTIICSSCKKSCESVNCKEMERHDNSIFVNAKSTCCNDDIIFLSRITCSDKCHEELVKRLENDFGKTKLVTDSETGITYEVPTRDIVEKGITQQKLSKYPVWKEG